MQETLSACETAEAPAKLTSHARIIVVSQFFGPDQSAVGQFLADFASEATAAGHDVHVLCGANDYAMAISDASGEALIPIGEHESSTGRGEVRITRIRTAKFSQNKLQKLLSYAIFYAGALLKALTIPGPDVIVTLTAPPGLAWIGWLVRKTHGCRHVAWEMDLYPDIAVALGIPLSRWTARMLDFPRRRADAVIALGPCMKARLLQHGIQDDRIVIAENWADGQAITPSPFATGWPLRILYSGNLGLAHDVGTIRAVMERLADESNLLFVFAGGGLEREGLIRFCSERGIRNVAFQDYVRRKDLGLSLGGCHVGLVTQKLATLGAVVPSKIYGLMAAGRPILYIGPAEATPALLIRRFNCGWHFNCGDIDGISALLLRLFESPTEIYAKGRNGREAFDRYYDKPVAVSRVLRALHLNA